MAHTPLRRCVHCRQMFEKTVLIQVTRELASGAFALFLPNRLSGEALTSAKRIQGRSAYVCQQTACLQPALKSQKLQKALKCQIPGDIVMVLSEELEGLRSGDTVKKQNL